MIKRKRRKKRRHYHTGVYVSTKTGSSCKYRSGWEEKFMNYLDVTPEVTTWTYENVVIPYVSNKKTGKVRKYYPDFYVEYASGDKIIIEIKPSKRVTQAKVAKKLSAAREHCVAHGLMFRVLTEVDLRILGLL